MTDVIIVADSICKGNRLITFQLRYPRIIHAEVLTHRCLAGGTMLAFDMPKAKTMGDKRYYSMTIKDFYEKWTFGVAKHKAARLKCVPLSEIEDNIVYSAKEISSILGYTCSGNLRKQCRLGKCVAENPNKRRGEDWLIMGSSFKKFRSSYGTRTFSIRKRLSEMNLRMYNEKTGLIEGTQVTDCWHVGIKPVFELTAGDYKLKSTDDHLILTDRGWMELKDINIGDKVIVQSQKSISTQNPIKHKKINGTWTSKWNKKNIAEVSERQENVCCDCHENKKLEIHHIVPVHISPELAFETKNVVALCHKCHKKRHNIQGWQKSEKLNGQFVPVEKIEYIGEEDVYDLSVDSVYHNFLANGIVVHNCFARNSASSRAIPDITMIRNIIDEPFIPNVWIKSHKGMQGSTLLSREEAVIAREAWIKAKRLAIESAYEMREIGVTKQLVNRILEPYSYIDVILTAEYDSEGLQNFFDLRCSKFPDEWKYWEHTDEENFKMSTSGAQWEMQNLANQMFNAISNSRPIEKKNEWHIPYYNDEINESTIMKSVARCARISYNNHLKELDLHEASVMYAKLLNDRHMSPFEHICKPDAKKHKGCFKQWAQLRHTISPIK